LGGILHEAGNDLSHKMGSPLGRIAMGLGGFGYVITRWSRELETRKGIVARWSDDDKEENLLASIGIATGVVEVGQDWVEVSSSPGDPSSTTWARAWGAA
jgi:hypothetical protein